MLLQNLSISFVLISVLTSHLMWTVLPIFNKRLIFKSLRRTYTLRMGKEFPPFMAYWTDEWYFTCYVIVLSIQATNTNIHSQLLVFIKKNYSNRFLKQLID